VTSHDATRRPLELSEIDEEARTPGVVDEDCGLGESDAPLLHLSSLLADLDAATRAVFILAEVEAMTPGEVAEVLEAASASARGRSFDPRGRVAARSFWAD